MRSLRVLALTASVLGALCVFANSKAQPDLPRQNARESQDGKAVVATPTSVAQLARSIWDAAQSDILFQADFYSVDNLKTFFAATDVERIFVEGGKPKPFTKYYMSGFSDLFPLERKKTPTFPPMQASLTTTASSEKIRTASVQVLLQVDDQDPDLEIEKMTHALGGGWAGWREDYEAENSLFLTVTRELFNPASAAEQARRIRIFVWKTTDSKFERQMTLEFGPTRRLTSLQLLISKREME